MTKNVHAIIKRALSKFSADFKYLSGRFREKLVTYDEGPLPRVICDQINLGCIIKKINVGEKRINESVQSDRFWKIEFFWKYLITKLFLLKQKLLLFCSLKIFWTSCLSPCLWFSGLGSTMKLTCSQTIKGFGAEIGQNGESGMLFITHTGRYTQNSIWNI